MNEEQSKVIENRTPKTKLDVYKTNKNKLGQIFAYSHIFFMQINKIIDK